MSSTALPWKQALLIGGRTFFVAQSFLSPTPRIMSSTVAKVANIEIRCCPSHCGPVSFRRRSFRTNVISWICCHCNRSWNQCQYPSAEHSLADSHVRFAEHPIILKSSNRIVDTLHTELVCPFFLPIHLPKYGEDGQYLS